MLESFLKLLRGERPDRVVWTADLTYWLAGQTPTATADHAWNTEAGYLQLHQGLGVMPYYQYWKYWLAEPEYDKRIEIGQEERAGRTLSRIRTPVGELVEETTRLPESCCSAITQHYVQSEKDLDVLRYLVAHRRLVPANLDGYRARMQRWREYDGLPAIGLPRAPLAAFCCEWAGVQNMAYLLADCEEKVAGLLCEMAEQEAPILEAICDLAPPLVHFPDNLASDNLTGLYDRYLGDCHRRRIDRLHGAGTKCAVHLDGAVKGLLPKLVAAGFDAIESLTPQPVGDLDAAEMVALAGDRVILWGGVPGALFAPPFTWADVEAHVKRVLECWQGRPFVLGVADQVPPDGNVDFCRRIGELLQPA